MAIQNSIIKLRGSIDDLVFLETKNGHKVRKKAKAVSQTTIATDPKYARMRENMSEFGRAANASKLLRTAVKEAMPDCTDSLIFNRLTKAMYGVLVTDPVSDRGQRNVMKGDVSLLNEFTFNSTAILSVIFKMDITTGIDRASGKLTVDIPAFIPADNIMAPAGATHCKFHSAGAEINFDSGQFVSKQAESAAITVGDNLATAAIHFQHDLTAGSNSPLFLLLGTRFYQEVNGKLYPLKNKAFNALLVTDADSV